MNVLKVFIAGWMALVAVLIFLFDKSQPSAHAKLFCAYGRVFVEFNEGPHQWGVLMLDYEGRPVPCEDDVKDLPVNTKETI